jgi:hypothetical protein
LNKREFPTQQNALHQVSHHVILSLVLRDFNLEISFIQLLIRLGVVPVGHDHDPFISHTALSVIDGFKIIQLNALENSRHEGASKTKYRTTNWKEYNAALKTRGSLLIWLDKDVCWHGSASGKRGQSLRYSKAAIQFCLTIKGMFNLPFR